jgi:hypothetical protein
MKAGLGESRFHAAIVEGRAMPLSRAIQFGTAPLSLLEEPDADRGS